MKQLNSFKYIVSQFYKQICLRHFDFNGADRSSVLFASLHFFSLRCCRGATWIKPLQGKGLAGWIVPFFQIQITVITVYLNRFYVWFFFFFTDNVVDKKKSEWSNLIIHVVEITPRPVEINPRDMLFTFLHIPFYSDSFYLEVEKYVTEK